MRKKKENDPGISIQSIIQEAKTQHENTLDLSVDFWGVPHFSEIPPDVFELQWLSELSLSNEKLIIIPDEIGRLANLTSLDLTNNQLTKLPDTMAKLKNLSKLNLSGNELKSIPDWIYELPNLTSLKIGFNPLENIPTRLGELKTLKELDLSGYDLDNVPEWIANLSKLTSLDLSGNNLADFPKWATLLIHLENIDFHNNRFVKIPNVVFDMLHLKELSFANYSGRIRGSGDKEYTSNNVIEKLPIDILKLKNLTKLNLHNNPIKTPPSEIVFKKRDKGEGFTEFVDLDKLRNYFVQLEKEGVDYIYEAKLLLVGEGGAGKTTLAKKINDPNFQLVDNEKSTEGIEVTQWLFSTENGKNFRANIWDFGGQEIYHATHQFFLTKRSLYVLVTDTRKEDTDFYYWLNIVELLSNNSPVFIVKNEKQDRHREIGERQLRGQFTNLQTILATNLATNRGLQEITDEIKHHISRLPHIGSPLPKTWVIVREALENDTRNYISLEEYLNICEKNGFTRLEDKVQLSGYLHDLGVCLHFQEDPLLRKIVILKPKWGTDAVYKALDNKKVIQNLGKFTRTDLANIWNASEYDNMHNELLQLMINFKLCYQISGYRDVFIAPQLLTENQPVYDWDEKDNIILRYSYEFMPKGILTQFIVAMHKHIVDQKLVWKSGVVLEKDQTRAEIVEYYGKREIQIRVNGLNKRDFMAVIVYQLDSIHASYNRLKFAKLIPCNCEFCKKISDPHFYSFETLRKFASDRQNYIQCQKSYEMVDVWGLLDNVISTEASQRERGGSKADDKFVFQGTVEQVVIQQAQSGSLTIQQSQNGDGMKEIKSSNKPTIKSAWANGSFYLFTFVVVVAGIGILARSISPYVLPIVLVAGIIFVPIIGALQLRQDRRLSEKSFLSLMTLVIKQLPMINNIASKFQKQKKRGS